MAKYQKTPEYVEAFQMNEDNQQNVNDWPEWAKDCAAMDNRLTGAIFPTDPRNPKNGFNLKNEYDVFTIPLDAWVVSNGQSYMIMQNNHFKAAFIKATSDEGNQQKAVDTEKEKPPKTIDSTAKVGKV